LFVQIDSRDNEVERLTKMLEGGRPHDVVALEAKNRTNERMISHLNIQVSNERMISHLNIPRYIL